MNPWWSERLEQLRPRLLRLALRRIGEPAEDAVADTVSGVLSDLRRREGSLPSSWFAEGEGAPDDEETLQFDRLVYQVLRRRMADRLRARYRVKFEELHDGIPAQRGDPEAEIVRRQFIYRAFSVTLEELDRLTRWSARPFCTQPAGAATSLTCCASRRLAIRARGATGRCRVPSGRT